MYIEVSFDKFHLIYFLIFVECDTYLGRSGFEQLL